jgi:anti-sigma factor ChrR (cupin superfamily)
MSLASDKHEHENSERIYLYALKALPSSEVPAVEAHISSCAECQQELQTLRPVVESFVSWPTDVLRPSTSLWERIEQRIAPESRDGHSLAAPERWREPEWENVAPGISCKLLATDTERDLVSMLVRLEPGTDYPPHCHAGVEELHLLEGELMIDDRKLYPGAYNRAEPGTADSRVWSETGCTCVLITSTRDELR